LTEREFTVTNEFGLHARPAGQVATLAAQFEANLEIASQNEWVSARSVLSMLSLAIGPGSLVRVRAEGPDEENAVDAIGALLVGLGNGH
jgi:phosphocarrier protein